MATRSRTALFCKYRDSLKTHRKTPLRGASGMLVEGRQTKNLLSALSDDESSAIDARAYSVPPAWVTLVDDLNRDISSIKIKVADLNELSGKHLLPGFGEEDEREEQIAQTVQEITVLFKECEQRLKRMTSQKDEGRGDEVRRTARPRPAAPARPPRPPRPPARPRPAHADLRLIGPAFAAGGAEEH